jgi:integrase
MSKTYYGKFNQAQIKRWLSSSDCRDFKDARYPQVTLRANAARSRASVFLVVNRKGKTFWQKRGAWPLVCIDTLLGELPAVMARLAEQQAPVSQQFVTVGQLLNWYVDHIWPNKTLSASWRRNCRSIVKTQLQPLSLLAIADLTFLDIDEKLIKPMLANEKAPNYIRLAVQVLKRAFGAAADLRLLASNPLAGYQVQMSIRLPLSKGAQLVESDIAELFTRVKEQPQPAKVFFLLMLMFGTRINETRLARWEHFAGDFWYLPAEHTKSGTEHRLPLTATAKALLQAYQQWQLKTKGKRMYLFAGKDAVISIRTAQYWSERIRFKEFTSHSLRKLCRTIIADLGVDTMVGERILNHALPVLLRTYVHSQLNSGMTNALEDYHKALLAKGFADCVAEIAPRSSLDPQSTQGATGAGWL